MEGDGSTRRLFLCDHTSRAVQFRQPVQVARGRVGVLVSSDRLDYNHGHFFVGQDAGR